MAGAAIKGKRDGRVQKSQHGGAEFNDVNLGQARFINVNLAGATFEDINLSGVTIENANTKGLTIFGYDVHGWLKEQLEKDGCHLD